MSDSSPPNREDVVALRFSPRRVPFCLYPLIFHLCFHAAPSFCVVLLVFVSVLKMMGLDGFESTFREQFSSRWKPSGAARVVSIEASTLRDFKIPFYDVRFEFIDSAGKTRTGECACFRKKYEPENQYPLELLQERWTQYRLVGAWTSLFKSMVELSLVFGLILLQAVIILGIGWRSGKRKLDLLRYGVATEGTFIEFVPIRFWGRFIPFVRAVFQFQDEENRLHRATQVLHRKMVKKNWKDVKTLFYDTENPSRYLFLDAFGPETIYDSTAREMVVDRKVRGAGYATGALNAFTMVFCLYFLFSFVFR